MIPWHKLERRVYKLQKRIYRASQRGEIKAVRRLQKTLMKSWSARALSVRRVTQDNQGKKTAGVDGVKSLTPVQRLRLTGELKLDTKVSPTRRVWIPKPGTEEKRPLGIPTMKDRALQALVLLALEPEWEARFEPNSYGFRTGRSCNDAIAAIYTAINQKAKFVLDADISKCFDRINQEALLRKLNTFPTLRRQVRAWLKAGVMDSKQLFPTSEGVPQGGVVSPLLANIALHGMEYRIKELFPKKSYCRNGKTHTVATPDLIRYADDFVILHEDITVVTRCREVISEWLKSMSLELKPSKTKIVHTLNPYELEKPGFDFLGFNIRQYPVGKHHSGTNARGQLLGFKTLITPSRIQRSIHQDQIASVIDAHKSAPQAALIKRLNPMIRGWANYYATVVSKEAYAEQDYLIYQQLRAWAIRRHPNKSRGWIANKYWQTIGGDNWVFATPLAGKNPLRLLKHCATEIKRHIKVKGCSSPYDGNLVYWSSRIGKNPEMPSQVAALLKRQKGKCSYCGLYFRESDVMEVDHIVPKSNGGRDSNRNYQLLHRHCHHKKTALDRSSSNRSVDYNAEVLPIKRLIKVEGKWELRYS